MKPSPAFVPDRNYKEWFSGSDIFQNIRETIREVEIPLAHPNLDQEGSLSMTMDTSIEEMFQLAPSALAGRKKLFYVCLWFTIPLKIIKLIIFQYKLSFTNTQICFKFNCKEYVKIKSLNFVFECINHLTTPYLSHYAVGLIQNSILLINNH